MKEEAEATGVKRDDLPITM